MAAVSTPPATLSSLENAILSDVVITFVNFHQSILRRALLIKYEGQPAWQAINNLVNRNFLVRHGSSSGEEAYLPQSIAFNFCADAQIRNSAKAATTVVLHTLKQMYKAEQKREGFVFEDLKKHVEEIYPTRMFDSSTLKLGLYIAKDFNVLQGYRLNSPEDTEVLSFQVGDGAISISDPEAEWDRVMGLNNWRIEGVAVETASLERAQKADAISWERVKPLGGGGQSEVFLVRSKERTLERSRSIERIRSALAGGDAAELAEASGSYARPDLDSELAALKMFKIRPQDNGIDPVPGSDEFEAVERLKKEITVLSEGRPGLPKLLDSSIKDRWIVTEYFSGKTLHEHPLKFRGKTGPALKAFRSLVQTVALLHKDGYVHRDIKPPNVFIRTDDELVLGDFGIVYIPITDRITFPNERVGPRDYMPPWAHRGKRVENVDPCWDVYMLGKLLWCMVDGRQFLPREDYDEVELDLTKNFPGDRSMQVLNRILAKCLVKKPEDCLKSAEQLLKVVDESLALIERGLPMLDDRGRLSVPCHVCGKGFYKEHTTAQVPTYDAGNMHTGALRLRVFVCDVCFHYELFAPGFPNEAVQRGWKP